ncbi:Transmembrane protein 97 [Coemansia sp. RSA 989]|nr:Transmembrane protein 97 [Coemansia sp. RSA 1086]KAJ1752796.1 Transmembrane protein 97 [Coemansia sp. RSA 1821]KAJ1865779.1 Transmembrane protein 97 [Coemansia sp. RSA 989]KAJ1875209.1 Transmembrane protein 97 [Coemansia sp. RSA 990]KAJ2671887.1 Transmembrane protein 97 [Coemansia sp. RSA 1085]
MTRQLLDYVYLIYFATHIPITLAVDILPLLPTSIIPQPLLALNRFLTATLKDPFMGIGPRSDLVWFRSLLACELFLQLPFFFYAVHALRKRLPQRFLPLLVYGVHVATTMAPVLGTLAFGDIGRSCMQRMMLGAMYVPYLLVPLIMAVDSFIQCTAPKLKSF